MGTALQIVLAAYTPEKPNCARVWQLRSQRSGRVAQQLKGGPTADVRSKKGGRRPLSNRTPSKKKKTVQYHQKQRYLISWQVMVYLEGSDAQITARSLHKKTQHHGADYVVAQSPYLSGDAVWALSFSSTKGIWSEGVPMAHERQQEWTCCSTNMTTGRWKGSGRAFLSGNSQMLGALGWNEAFEVQHALAEQPV